MTVQGTLRAAARDVAAAVRRSPGMALLAVAVWTAVAVLVYLLVRGRKEGWTFRNEMYLNKRHWGWVWDKCRNGKTLADITRDDSVSWLAKYRLDEVSNVCAQAIGRTKKEMHLGADYSSICTKNGVCDDPVLFTMRPCQNKDQTKCCAKDGKDCKKKFTGTLTDDLKKTGQFGKCPGWPCGDKAVAKNYPCQDMKDSSRCCKFDGSGCQYRTGYPESTSTTRPPSAPASTPASIDTSGLKVETWKNSNFSGSYQTFGIGDHKNVWYNDGISSMKIPQGIKVIIYRDSNFGGSHPFELYAGEYANLKGMSWDREAFRKANPHSVHDPNKYSSSFDFNNEAGSSWNDRISSIKVMKA